jgi:hypothetical protein
MDINNKVMLEYMKSFNKPAYDKLIKIKDKSEQEEALKYSLVSYLEKEYHHLEKRVNEMEQKEKDVFFAKAKLLLVPSKIKFVKAGYYKSEIDKVINLLNNIKEEINNV